MDLSEYLGLYPTHYPPGMPSDSKKQLGPYEQPELMASKQLSDSPSRRKTEMSENARHCPYLISPQRHRPIHCIYNHELVHKFMLDDAQEQIKELKIQLEQKNMLLGAKFKTVTEMPPPEDPDHLGVDIKGSHVLLTLRGKSKLFTPKAIADVIRVLKKAYNAANNHMDPVEIHAIKGIEP